MLKPGNTESSKESALDNFLAHRPEHQRDFYADIYQALPSQYSLSVKGISFNSRGYNQSVPFCSPFRVKELVQAPSTKNWSRVVELLNPAGELVDCMLPEGKLTGKPREAIALLSDRGLRVFDDSRIRFILELVRNWEVHSDAHLALIEQVGWAPNRDAFILPSGRVLTPEEATPKYRFEGEPSGKEIGDLKTWQEDVAALAKGNTNLEFGISLGFSTALMTFTNLNSLIFHLFGKTSKGKTRALNVALSVWPKIGDKEKTWEGTGNGLEGEITQSHSILMGLDELRADATPDLPEIVYKFANSSGKARGTKEGGAQSRGTWKTNVFSNGEYSFVETVRQLGATPTGGQRVRMLDIPVKGAYGVFDSLHGFESSDAFVNHLDRVLKKASGPAGAAFVEQLLTLTEEALEQTLETDLTAHAQALQPHLGIVAGDDGTSEIRRVIRSFALISTAGEWATAWGITGWEPGTASEAVKTIAHRWLDEYLRMPAHHSEELEKVRDFIAENEARFIKLVSGPVVPSEDTLGYQDDEFFYVLPPTFVGLTKAKNKTLSALTDSGYLEKGGENKSLQTRLPSAVPRRPRAYRIRRSILEFQSNTETTTEVR